MAEYTKTVWSDGDIITAEIMNKIDNGMAEAGGGSGGSLVVPIEIDFSDPDNITVVTSFEDVLAAVQAGKKLGMPNAPDTLDAVDFYPVRGVTGEVERLVTDVFTELNDNTILSIISINSDGTLTQSQKTL